MRWCVDPKELVAALPAALLIVDERSVLRDINSEGEAILNMSASALLDRPLEDVIRMPESYSLANGAPFAAFDVDFETTRGRALRADLHATALTERAGWQLLTISNARDHGLGSGLERRGNSRTAIAIAATLAHEIKNPLSGIRGAAQLLEARSNQADGAMTQLICTEVDRITSLIDRMEGFTDTRPIELSAENIHAITDHARQVAQQGFGGQMIILDEYDPSLPPVLTHRDSLIQIIINLLKNAAETAENGEVRTVTLATRYRHGVALSGKGSDRRHPLPIELCVFDDGPGVPADIAEQLFDPFISGKRSGQGLGLALADKLVRDMGGLIQYSREGHPPRTVFRVLLQRAQGQPT